MGLNVHKKMRRQQIHYNLYFLIAITWILVMIVSGYTSPTDGSSVGVQYTIKPLLGHQQQDTKPWLKYEVKMVYESFQHPEQIVYLGGYVSTSVWSLMRLNLTDGGVETILETVGYLAKPINENGNDIFYCMKEEAGVCNLVKYNATSGSSVIIAGGRSCDCDSQTTTQLSEMTFCLLGLLSVHKKNDLILIYYSDYTRIYEIDERQSSVKKIPGFDDLLHINSIHVNSNNDLYIAALYTIRKLHHTTGNITTIISLSGSSNFLTFELDNNEIIDSVESFYYFKFPDFQIFKTTVKYSGSSIIGMNTTSIGGAFITSGDSGDGGLATDASINFLNSLSVIGSKLWLIGINHIRQIDLKTGIISSLFSKNGMRVFNMNAQDMKAPFLLRSPKDLIYSDSSGSPSLLILEAGSASILNYTLSDGNIGIVENTLVPLSQDEPYRATPIISNPYSIALDLNSNLLISNDISYWTVNFLVKLNKSNTASHSILFGNKFSTSRDAPTNVKSSVLNRPSGVSSFASSNDILIFVSDTSNDRVLMISSTNGTISTIANKKDHGISGPSGITTLRREGETYVFFSDSNHCVWRIHLLSKTVSLIAGQPGIKGHVDGIALNSTFNHPSGIHAEYSAIYVADSNNHVIRKITLSTGIVSTVAGSGEPGYNGDGKLPLETQFNNPMGVISAQMGLIVAVSFITYWKH